MGRVFTWEEIVQNRLPNPPQQQFSTTVAYLREALEESSDITGALLFGSAMRDDWTIRSDIDCLVVTNEDWFTRHLCEITKHSLTQWNVEISFEILTIQTARSGCHTIGPMFRNYLQRIEQKNVIRNNPLSFLSPNEFSTRLEFRNYLMIQEDRLRKGLFLCHTFDPHQYSRFLRKVLESGIHIARKHLQYRGHVEAVSAEEVLFLYPRIFGSTAGALLHRLANADDAYTKAIIWQQRYGPNESRYQQALEQVESLTLLALEFVALNWKLLK